MQMAITIGSGGGLPKRTQPYSINEGTISYEVKRQATDQRSQQSSPQQPVVSLTGAQRQQDTPVVSLTGAQMPPLVSPLVNITGTPGVQQGQEWLRRNRALYSASPEFQAGLTPEARGRMSQTPIVVDPNAPTAGRYDFIKGEVIVQDQGDTGTVEHELLHSETAGQFGPEAWKVWLSLTPEERQAFWFTYASGGNVPLDEAILALAGVGPLGAEQLAAKTVVDIITNPLTGSKEIFPSLYQSGYIPENTLQFYEGTFTPEYLAAFTGSGGGSQPQPSIVPNVAMYSRKTITNRNLHPKSLTKEQKELYDKALNRIQPNLASEVAKITQNFLGT